MTMQTIALGSVVTGAFFWPMTGGKTPKPLPSKPRMGQLEHAAAYMPAQQTSSPRAAA